MAQSASEERAAFMAVRKDDMTEVVRGDKITDFRGNDAVFGEITRIPRDASTGRVITTAGAEVFPSVFDLVIVRRDSV